METKEAKRTLSKVKTLDSNKPETERNYYFYCWFDPVVRVREEFQEARKYCDTYESDGSGRIISKVGFMSGQGSG